SKHRIHIRPSLYPVLLVLGRLFPSTLEGSDTSLNLSAFIPYVIRCAASPVYKTRVIASRALLPLAKRNQVIGICCQLLECIPEARTNENVFSSQVHGLLLQLCQLAKLIQEMAASIEDAVFHSIVSSLRKRTWMISSDNTCSATRQAALLLTDVVLDISGTGNHRFPESAKVVEELGRIFLSALLQDSSSSEQVWQPLYFDLEKTRAMLCLKHVAGVSTVSAGVSAVSAGVSTVSAGVSAVSAGVSTVSAGVSAVSAGVSAVSAGVSTVSAGVSAVSADVSTVSAGVSTVSAGVSTVSAGDSTVSAGVGTVSAGDSTVSAGDSTMSAGVSTVSAGVSTVAAGSAASRAESTELADKLSFTTSKIGLKDVLMKLLDSPLYEVRLEVLDLLWNFLRTDGIKKGQDLSSTKCGNVNASSGDFESCTSAVETEKVNCGLSNVTLEQLSPALFDHILTMALETETHHECLQK
ncbi:unnamed protein product, partial [Candidula unifasciata]